MLNRPFLVVLALWLASSIGLGYWVYRQDQELLAASLRESALEDSLARASRSIARERKLRLASQESARKLSAELYEALVNNQTWANTPVPESIGNAVQ